MANINKDYIIEEKKMNIVDIILQTYKNELAQANEQKIIAQIKYLELKQKVGQLEEEIKQLKQEKEKEE